MAGFNPLAFARTYLGFMAEGPQADVLERAPKYRVIALNCSRQWGKSTVAAVLAVARLLARPGVTVLLVGPVARQSGETLLKVRHFLKVLGVKVGTDKVNEDSAVLPNGSRIIGLPAMKDTVRGYSAVSMLIIDEAAFVDDDVYLALRPSLAVLNGDLILLSTPNGRRGFFYREMISDRPGVLRHTGPVTECTHISEEFLAEERAQGESHFQQEYMCEFVETGRYPFDEALA